MHGILPQKRKKDNQSKFINSPRSRLVDTGENTEGIKLIKLISFALKFQRKLCKSVRYNLCRI